MARKRYKAREVLKILRKHDKRFEFYENRGKGSERMIFHPDVDGKSRSIPITYHGKGTEVGAGMLKAIIRRFNLPEGLF